MEKIKNFIFGKIRGLYTKSKYDIKRGYFHRREADLFNDIANKDEWQKEVYIYSKEVFLKNNYNSLVDFGCGSAYKLIEHFSEYYFVGVEIETTLTWLKNKYPKFNWKNIYQIENDSFDLAICSDVIEHVPEPDSFIQKLNNIDFKKLIISTPERINKRGKYDFGPPANKYHFREWSYQEFERFMSKYFKIEKHFISNIKQSTQVIVCSKK